MALYGYGYAGRCRLAYRENSTNSENSGVITRKMTEEEKIKYGIKLKDKTEEQKKDEV